jgi:hypothetical protein
MIDPTAITSFPEAGEADKKIPLGPILPLAATTI